MIEWLIEHERVIVDLDVICGLKALPLWSLWQQPHASLPRHHSRKLVPRTGVKLILTLHSKQMGS